VRISKRELAFGDEGPVVSGTRIGSDNMDFR
jgi:hypothetical protein